MEWKEIATPKSRGELIKLALIKENQPTVSAIFLKGKDNALLSLFVNTTLRNGHLLASFERPFDIY